MNGFIIPALKSTLLSAVVVLASVSPVFAQRRMSVGDYYGSGPEGTIGRGTDRLPGGPSDWGGSGFPSNNSPYYYYYSSDSKGYVTPPVPAQSTARPYLTSQTYAPGDGYRYPLYYNPARRMYYYYPVTRR